MSLKITTFHVTSGSVKPRTYPRMFNISPAFNGTSSFNLSAGQKINIGSYGTWTITPNSTFTASVKMWGAGASGFNYPGLLAYGGSSGFSSGSVQFQSGSSYILTVGQGGSVVTGTSGPLTTGGGGYGRDTGYATNPRGGGLSGVFLTSYTQANAIMIAGGGGAAAIGNNTAGSGGGSSGQDSNAQHQGNGYGGTQVAGGGANNGGTSNGTAGTALVGGLGSTYSGAGTGAGGGGYFGGGGGTYAGAGGSGYIKGTVINGVTVAGVTVRNVSTTPGNSADAERGGAGSGGYNASAGSNGRIIII